MLFVRPTRGHEGGYRVNEMYTILGDEKITPASALVGLSEKEKKAMKFSILKNVVIISVAFTFLFTAYNASANLQSSLNA